ncbi:hypothetical protein [Nostoc sp. MG11]|nr:hypothetical protein [Nostoc sp. MG11]
MQIDKSSPWRIGASLANCWSWLEARSWSKTAEELYLRLCDQSRLA